MVATAPDVVVVVGLAVVDVVLEAAGFAVVVVVAFGFVVGVIGPDPSVVVVAAPARPVVVVVGFAPFGGGTDQVRREDPSYWTAVGSDPSGTVNVTQPDRHFPAGTVPEIRTGAVSAPGGTMSRCDPMIRSPPVGPISAEPYDGSFGAQLSGVALPVGMLHGR